MATHIRAVTRRGTALAWTNGRSLTIDRNQQGRGLRIGFTADELLSLAIGANYLDALMTEAERQHVSITSVNVDVAPDSSDADRGLAVSISVEAGADETVIMDLIERTDKRASVCNMLRLGRAVRVLRAEVSTI